MSVETLTIAVETIDADGVVASTNERVTPEAGIDRDLVARFVAGDRDAAQRLIDHTTPTITRLVQRLLAWPPAVDDVVQEVYVAALAKRSSFRQACRFETWLTRIAINECRRFRRKEWTRQRLWQRFAPQLARPTQSVPEDRVVASETSCQVRQAVSELPMKLREVVVLYYLEEMSARQVADLLCLKTGTVEVRLSRARRKLKLALEDQSDDE